MLAVLQLGGFTFTHLHLGVVLYKLRVCTEQLHNKLKTNVSHASDASVNANMGPTFFNELLWIILSSLLLTFPSAQSDTK